MMKNPDIRSFPGRERETQISDISFQVEVENGVA